ncbi:MAG: hypothetical protein OEM52_01945 [bacterium]|nr:hypothetical protein [bacterium]
MPYFEEKRDGNPMIDDPNEMPDDELPIGEESDSPEDEAIPEPKAKGWLPIKLRGRHILIAITGHGFGHAVRVLQVANRLKQLDPQLEFTVVTPVAEWFLRDALRVPFRLLPMRLDLGTVQSDAIEADPLATLQQYEQFILHREALFNSLQEALVDTPVDLVLSDLPPVASEFGAWLGVPVVGIGNFSWDWIYGEYAEMYPEYSWVVEEIRTQYQMTDLLLELPYAGDLSAFPERDDIPWICRKGLLEPQETRKRLKLDPIKPIAVVSFGGLGMDVRLPDGEWSKNIDFFVMAPVNRIVGKGKVVENSVLASRHVTFPDLIRAASVVVTKPGYGIVSECIAAGVPMLYASRKHFREYPLLVNGMKRHIRAEELTKEMLTTGEWKPAFEALLGKRTLAAEPDPDTDGDKIAAELIMKKLES